MYLIGHNDRLGFPKTIIKSGILDSEFIMDFVLKSISVFI